MYHLPGMIGLSPVLVFLYFPLYGLEKRRKLIMLCD